MEWLLEKEDLWEVISVAKPEPVTAEWTNRDRKARANIGLFLDESQFKLVKNAESARGMWNALQQHHEKATMSTVVHYLNQLCSANMAENGNMEEHLNSMEDLFDKLIAAGQNLDESLQIAMIFRSVPPSYRSLVQSLQCRPDEDWTVVLVKARLLDEYNQRRERSEVLSSDMKALRLDASGSKSEKVCYFCKEPGHFRKHCKKLQSKKSGCENEKKQRYRKDDNHKGGNPKAKQADDARGSGGSVCFMAGDVMPDCWVIDSGATRHMTSDRSFFTSMDNSENSRVTLADGNKTKVCGVGEGVLFGENGRGERVEVTLKNVLFVPGLDGGLISVSQLAAKGFVAKFGASACEIQNADGDTVVVGDKVSNLYRLRIHERSLKVDGEHHERCQHTWHRRIGHRDPEVLRRIEAEDLVSGFSLLDCGARIVCECCLKGKFARKPFPAITDRKTTKPLELIHTDLCGPMETTTPSGNRYLMTLIDDYSRYTTVYLLKKKSEASARIQQYVRWVQNRFGRKPLAIRSDGGGEYIGRELREFYEAEGIEAQFTTPYSPQQNGVAERRNRYLQEMAICMLADAGLGKLYWGEAVMTAAYLQNRLPSRVVSKTPYELWTGRKPRFEHLRVFGCDAYVHVPDAKRSKLDEKSIKLTFVGYSEDHKGYRFLDRATNRVTLSRDARFIELENGSERPSEKKSEAVPEDLNGSFEIRLKSSDRGIAENGEALSDSEGWNSAEDDDDREEEEPQPAAQPPAARPQEELAVQRDQRKTRGVLPSRYDDFVVGIAEFASVEPTDYRKALEIPKWKEAMDSEIESHEANKTWKLVRLPEGRKVIGSRWVYKIKRDESGEIVKHKARLVAQGYNQRYGIDYVDVFAPVTRQETLRALLAVAGKERMILQHLDVKTAYLHGTIEEEIYMRQPPGYEAAGKEDMVCRLRKSIYGLKQSARCWNRALHATLLKLNFEQCESDPCLYVRREGGKTVYLLVYVDDILVASTDAAAIEAVFQALRKDFDITNLGKVKQFLGQEVRCNGGFYSLRLSSYIDGMIEKFGLKDCNPAKSPMDPSYIKSDSNSKPFEDITRYRSLVGALLYVAVNARPDVAVSVSLLGRKVSGPTEMDWTAAKRVVRYLKGTRDYRLEFGPGQGWSLEGYSDADWAGDQESRKSTSGYIFFFGTGPIAWVSHKQACVSLSSMEAEYVALSEACQELLWLRRLMEDLGQAQQCTTIFEDNQSCLSFINTERTSKRSKHIDTKRHFIKDLVDQRVVKLEFCPSDRMIADTLTKPLGTTMFWKMLESTGLTGK